MKTAYLGVYEMWRFFPKYLHKELISPTCIKIHNYQKNIKILPKYIKILPKCIKTLPKYTKLHKYQNTYLQKHILTKILIKCILKYISPIYKNKYNKYNKIKKISK